MNKELKAKLNHHKAVCNEQEAKANRLLADGANPDMVNILMDGIKTQRETIALLERIGGLI